MRLLLFFVLLLPLKNAFACANTDSSNVVNVELKRYITYSCYGISIPMSLTEGNDTMHISDALFTYSNDSGSYIKTGLPITHHYNDSNTAYISVCLSEQSSQNANIIIFYEKINTAKKSNDLGCSSTIFISNFNKYIE